MYFTKAPPTSSAPSYKIVVCKAAQPLLFVSVCDQYVGTMTHWWGGHTVACDYPKPCEACNRNIRREFKSWIAAESVEFGTRVIVQITHSCCLELARHLAKPRGILGLKIKLQRATASDTSMLQISTFGFEEVTHPVAAETLENTMRRVLAANAGNEPNQAA